MKRKLEQALRDVGVYERVHQLIQALPQVEADGLFQSLRRGVDPATVLRQVTEGNLLRQGSPLPDTHPRYDFPFATTMPVALQAPGNPYLASLLYESALGKVNLGSGTDEAFQSQQTAQPYLQAYLNPYHTAEIIDSNLDAVTTASWTTVISDNGLLRALLHAYFLHDYSTSPVFHKDIFLYAMANDDHRLCSPLLVNAILAQASVSI